MPEAHGTARSTATYDGVRNSERVLRARLAATGRRPTTRTAAATRPTSAENRAEAERDSAGAGLPGPVRADEQAVPRHRARSVPWYGDFGNHDALDPGQPAAQRRPSRRSLPGCLKIRRTSSSATACRPDPRRAGRRRSPVGRVSDPTRSQAIREVLRPEDDGASTTVVPSDARRHLLRKRGVDRPALRHTTRHAQWHGFGFETAARPAHAGAGQLLLHAQGRRGCASSRSTRSPRTAATAATSTTTQFQWLDGRARRRRRPTGERA